MSSIDVVGYLAASLVLTTFCMKAMVPLRVLAIASNFAFMLYGHLAAIAPVFWLHVVLLPINVARFVEALGAARQSASRRTVSIALREGPRAS